MSKDQEQRLVMRTKAKSCELDPIPTTLVMNILPSILPEITKIITLSLLSGTILQNWKTAIVTPLLKGQGMELLNYRPISNLPYIAKLVKKAMLEQINLHCNVHSLLLDYQSVYRENRSCETVLLKFTNDLLWSMERKNVTAMIGLDLSAAFNTVDHKVLLTTLQSNFGIKGMTFKWFKNNLALRDMTVKIERSYSERKELTFCIPQGFCSGVYLFNMSSSTISEEVDPGLSIIAFADDHATPIKQQMRVM